MQRKPVKVNMASLYEQCGMLDCGRAIQRDLFEKVVKFFASVERASVKEASEVTGVLANHVGTIVNRLCDFWHMRVLYGDGVERYPYKQPKFMLMAAPDYEPLFQTEYEPRPENVSWIEFPRWGDNMAPLIDAMNGYTRRRA